MRNLVLVPSVPLTLSIVASLLVLHRSTRADEGEWRIGLAAGAAVTSVRAGGVDGAGAGLGARARVGRGLSNTIELGLFGGYAHAANVELDGATLEGQIGTLFADVSVVMLGVELRYTPGVGLTRAFERTGPYLAARAGGALVLRTSQQLFTAAGLLVLDRGDDLDLAVLAGGALGIEHRFGDHLFVGAEVGASLGVASRSLGFTVEAAWAWY
jgi:hypothetical protein